MIVVCFCAHCFEVGDDPGVRCPRCGEPVYVPLHDPDVAAEMEAALRELIAEHEP